jgi:hypothetical protein
LSAAAFAATTASCANPEKIFALATTFKSSTCDPIATPPRNSSFESLRRNTAKGKF